MAAYDFTRAPVASTGLFTRLGGQIASIFAAYAAWQDSLATRRALNGLTDRELDDIGLVRGDIDVVAGDGVRRF
jgi:uncharacterized protein YjiS (DUF1127 family)